MTVQNADNRRPASLEETRDRTCFPGLNEGKSPVTVRAARL